MYENQEAQNHSHPLATSLIKSRYKVLTAKHSYKRVILPYSKLGGGITEV